VTPVRRICQDVFIGPSCVCYALFSGGYPERWLSTAAEEDVATGMTVVISNSYGLPGAKVAATSAKIGSYVFQQHTDFKGIIARERLPCCFQIYEAHEAGETTR
jgi:hypothetical protein